jgi:hypothetical protein
MCIFRSYGAWRLTSDRDYKQVAPTELTAIIRISKPALILRLDYVCHDSAERFGQPFFAA